MMTWKQFYDGYLCWSDSTVSSGLSQISDLQNADTTEIVDCCQCIDEALARRLLCKTEKVQLSFTYAQVAELAAFIGDEELLNTLAIAATGPSTQEDLEELNNNEIRDDVVTNIAKRYNLQDPNESAIWQPDALYKQIDDLAESVRQLTDNKNQINKNSEKKNQRRKLGLFAFLGVLGDSNRTKSSSGFRVGDHVRVKYRGKEGTKIDINGNLIMVSLDDGKHVDSYEASELEKAW